MEASHIYVHGKARIGRLLPKHYIARFYGTKPSGIMATACFNLQERLVPYLRALTARRLSDEGLRQDRIAEHLGVSQAMVSKYLRKPPRPAPGVPQATVERLVADAVQEALGQEQRGAIGAYCPACTALAGNGYCLATTPIEQVEQCLRHDRPAGRREQESVLQALRNAEGWIRREDFAPLMPAVRMNLAMGLKETRDTRDVAAFPGRLVELKGRVSAVSDAEFGSSSHLADLLIKMRKRRPAVRAILNVRWNTTVAEAAHAAGLALHELKRQGAELMVTVPETEELGGVVDPGGFGIEPNLYLVGPDAEHVVRQALELRKGLSTRTSKVTS